jgi:hypothetical protein
MALLVLAGTFCVIAQLLVIASHQQREHGRRRVAVLETANLMERAVSLSWDAVSKETVEAMQLPPEAREQLPEARVQADVVDEEGTPVRKRVRIRVDWVNAAGQREQPVQLVAWKYRLERSATP